MRGWIAMLIPIGIVLYFGTHLEQFQKVLDWIGEVTR
jgi:hypothetical protein